MNRILISDDHIECARLLLKEVFSYVHPTTLVHVGAHEGQEVDVYKEFGIQRIHLIEANPETVNSLKRKFSEDKAVDILAFALGDSEGTAIFNVYTDRSGKTESSSLLPMQELGRVVDTLKLDKSVEVEVKTLDGLVANNEISEEDVNLLVVDVQGAELMVLKGAEQTLVSVEAAIVEVNLIETYKDVPREEDIDQFMEAMGFGSNFMIYHELYEGDHRYPAWGEKVYVKKGYLSDE